MISESLHKVVSICPSLGFGFSEIKWDNRAAANDAKSSKRGMVCDFIGAILLLAITTEVCTPLSCFALTYGTAPLAFLLESPKTCKLAPLHRDGKYDLGIWISGTVSSSSNHVHH